MAPSKLYALIDYHDTYVDPLLLAAIRARIPPELLVLIRDASELPNPSTRFLQWSQYENIDFERLLEHPWTRVANSFIIRKALIRKHFLSATVDHWSTKNPESLLRRHVRPSIAFELDFAEFLDDALLEAYELKESWERNAALAEGLPREWWILKPGMSERGQGIRLFSSEEELQDIFNEWDPPSDDEEDDEPATRAQSKDHAPDEGNTETDGIVTSQLRHFVVQPYIDPPLLLTAPHPAAGRKFHIRTYVVASGALQVHVYKPMLALFAEHAYVSPSDASSTSRPNDHLARHLTNTCLQTGTREGSVHAFWSLPAAVPLLLPAAKDWRGTVFDQICAVTAELFAAAARSMSVHFQPLPNAFEIFGLDFLVDACGTAWLLEVNAFPDFAQTGDALHDKIRGLFEGVLDVAVLPFFFADRSPVESSPRSSSDELVLVLDIDLGRR